jgi:NAD(P)-dependent dehydrogenase (short-subunit alcohol dehydrogenase family)
MIEQIIIKVALESPMKWWCTPKEVAKVDASFADDNFSYAAGITIVIDGGNILI